MGYRDQVKKHGRDHVLALKKADYQKHKEKRKAAVYAYRAENKEKWLAYNREYQRKRAAADPNYWRKKDLRRLYGLTIEEYEAMLVAQDHKCAICRGEFINDRRCVDHDHRTGQVRGILCDLCNVGVAFFGDDPWCLMKVIEYLAVKGKVGEVA